MEKEKEKRELEAPQNPHNWILRLIGLFVLSCCGTLAFLIVFGPAIGGFYRGNIFPLFLSSRFVSVDESLLDVPHQLMIPDENIGLRLNVISSPTRPGEMDICIAAVFLNLRDDEYRDYHNYSLFFVNGGRVLGTFLDFDSVHRYVSNGLQWCAYGDLQPGLHLIEFHLRDSSGETLHIQQWAVEVE